MTAVRRLVCALLLVTAFALVVEAKDWCGLLPLRSTREDVVQLMGEWQWAPAGRTTIYEPLTDSDPYYLAEGEVYFSYAPRIDERHDSLPRKIAPGTLLTIRFTPISPLDWSQLSVDRAAFRRLDGSSDENELERYADDADGLIVRLNAGKIVELIYFPRSEDREPFARYFDTLEQQGSSANATGDLTEREQVTEVVADDIGELGPDGSRESLVVDYGVVIVRPSYFDPKRTLDRAVIDLSEDLTAEGYITVYPDTRDNPTEFQLERDRVLLYLANERGIDRSRLFVSNGGMSHGTWFEITIVPANAKSSGPNPAVEPVGQFANRPTVICWTPSLLLYESDSNANLDVFAGELSNHPLARGYIVIYRNRDGGPDDGQMQVNRALDYLANEKGIDPGRLFILDGGLSEVTFTELWLVPEGAAPPDLHLESAGSSPNN